MFFNNKSLLINNIKNSYLFLLSTSKFSTYKLLVDNYINNYHKKLTIPNNLIGDENIYIMIKNVRKYVRKEKH